MSLLALGVNHHTAPVEMREKIAFPSERLGAALEEIKGIQGLQEASILSTCNRTELYCAMGDASFEPVIEWLSEHHQISRKQLEPYLYIHEGEAAVRHILRVAAGLDSMIIGEPQILGQMKTAYNEATQAGAIDILLGKLFQHTFSVAKQIRTDTAIGASPVSIAFAAVGLARQIFGVLNQQTALLIGAGETIELTARHLHQQNIGRMIVANRTVDRARELAAQFNGYAISLAEMPSHLDEADIVISSTASQLPILGKGTVETAFKNRKHRPMFILDIAVPRDVEPEVVELPDVYLYTVDDMETVIAENLASRREAAKQAEEIIDAQTTKFMAWLRSLDAVATICQFREEAEALRDEVLVKARLQLEQGKDVQETMDFLANTLTNKLLHGPSTNLRQAGEDGDLELIEAARKLYSAQTTEKKKRP